MDTVLGCEGSRKVLLTFHFSGCSFMMAYLLDSKESRHVKNVFDSIDMQLELFPLLLHFSLILTDRGGEFQIPDALECGEDNLIRTSIYYCDPMCSCKNRIVKRTMNISGKYARKERPLMITRKRISI